MPGIQLPIGIETVNPVDADYKKGPWPTVAAALAGIPLPLRYNNLNFYVVGDPNEYYWLDTDLSNAGLLIRSNGGALPIVRYVYLVQDASDATRMGGTLSNVYTTFQTAYDAANTLQVLLGGTNIVELLVGNITAAAAGDLTLTANYNARVHIRGLANTTSILGNIIASNASGNGFQIGTGLLPAVFNSVRIGNIDTRATGPTGNSGNLFLRSNNYFLGNINTNISNAANTIGNGGNISLQAFAGGTIRIGAIDTSTISGGAGSAGAVTISAPNYFIQSITTANNTIGGAVTAVGTESNGVIGTLNINSTTIGLNLVISNALINTANIALGNISKLEFQKCTITTLNTSSTTISWTSIFKQCNIVTYTGSLLNKIMSYNSIFSVMSNVGDNSVLSNTTVSDESGTNTISINGIGTGCRLLNISIFGGSTLGIDNPTPVNVQVTGLGGTSLGYIENGVGANITLI